MRNSFRDCSFQSSILAVALAIGGCPSGLDTNHIDAPPGAAVDIGAKNKGDFSPLTLALKYAHEHQSEPPVFEIERERKASEDLLPLLIDRAKDLINAPDSVALEKGLERAKGLDSAPDLAARILLIGDLSEVLRGPLKNIKDDIETVGSDEQKALLAAFLGCFCRRLMLEVQQLKSPLFMAIANTAKQATPKIDELYLATKEKSATQKDITQIKSLLSSFSSMSSNPSLAATYVATVGDSLEALKGSLAKVFKSRKRNKRNKAEFDRLTNELGITLKPVVKVQTTQLRTVEAALNLLNSMPEFYLNDLLLPLPLGESFQGHLEKTAVQQVEDALAKDQKHLLLSVVDEREMRFFEELFALKNLSVVSLDVIVMAAHAKKLRLNSDEFVNWLAQTINKFDHDRIVFLKGVGGLRFDGSSNDGHSENLAAFRNLTRLLHACTGARLIIPITKAHDYLLNERPAGNHNFVELKPYNLAFAQKIIAQASSYLGRELEEPSMLLAKIHRALKPSEFFVITLFDIVESLSSLAAQGNIDRASVVTRASTQFDATLLSDVLLLSPFLVEKTLAVSPLAFASSSAKNELLKAVAEGKATQQELMRVLKQAKKASRSSRKAATELIHEIDAKVVEGKVACGTALKEYRRQLKKLRRKQGELADKSVKKKFTELDQRLAEKIEEKEKEFGKGVVAIDEKVQELLKNQQDGQADLLKDYKEQLAKLIKENGEIADRTMAERVRAAEEGLEAALKQQEALLTKKTEEFEKQSRQKVAAFEEQIAETIRNNKSNMEKELREHQATLQKYVEDNDRIISEESRKKIAELKVAIENEIQGAHDGIEKRAQEFVEQTRLEMKNFLDEFGKQLESAKMMIQELAKQENHASTQAEKLKKLVGNVDTVKEWQEKSAKALEDQKEEIAKMGNSIKDARTTYHNLLEIAQAGMEESVKTAVKDVSEHITQVEANLNNTRSAATTTNQDLGRLIRLLEDMIHHPAAFVTNAVTPLKRAFPEELVREFSNASTRYQQGN